MKLVRRLQTLLLLHVQLSAIENVFFLLLIEVITEVISSCTTSNNKTEFRDPVVKEYAERKKSISRFRDTRNEARRNDPQATADFP